MALSRLLVHAGSAEFFESDAGSGSMTTLSRCLTLLLHSGRRVSLLNGVPPARGAFHTPPAAEYDESIASA